MVASLEDSELELKGVASTDDDEEEEIEERVVS